MVSMCDTYMRSILKAWLIGLSSNHLRIIKRIQNGWWTEGEIEAYCRSSKCDTQVLKNGRWIVQTSVSSPYWMISEKARERLSEA